MPQPFADEVAIARAAQAFWSRLTIGDRLRPVRSLRNLIAQRADALCEAVGTDIGRSAVEVLATELLPAAAALKFLEQRAQRVLAPHRVGWRFRPLWLMGCRDAIHRRAWGVVGVIGTWNYPVYLNVGPIVQAFVAGNAVLWKPSENAPRTADVLHALFLEAGFPAELFQKLPATREAGPMLAEAEVDRIVFTGSETVGRKLAAKLGERLIPSTMELSGCDAMIVLADANIELAAKAAWFGVTLNRGQTCIAVRRIFIQRTKYAAFEEAVRKLKPVVGSMELVTAGQVEQVQRLIEDAVKRGARALAFSAAPLSSALTPSLSLALTPRPPLPGGEVENSDSPSLSLALTPRPPLPGGEVENSDSPSLSLALTPRPPLPGGEVENSDSPSLSLALTPRPPLPGGEVENSDSPSLSLALTPRPPLPGGEVENSDSPSLSLALTPRPPLPGGEVENSDSPSLSLALTPRPPLPGGEVENSDSPSLSLALTPRPPLPGGEGESEFSPSPPGRGGRGVRANEREGVRADEREGVRADERIIPPMLLFDTPTDAAICREASFAPIAAIIPFDSIDEGVSLVKQCSFGLGASIFTSDVQSAQSLAARIPAGSVTINDLLAPTAHPATPFGGRGTSGWGVTQGAEGLLEMTVPQTVTIHTGTFRPHFDEAVNPDSATSDILRGLLRLTHARGLREKFRGLLQMSRGIRRKK